MADYAIPVSRKKTTAGTWWAFGVIFFAGAVMTMIGIFEALVGIAAILNSSFYVVSAAYAYKVDTAVWGWIHLLLGILVAASGFYLFFGKRWARIIAIIAALVSAVSNFLFIPYYPVWSLLIIALNVVVVWAVAAHGRELDV
jgi:hypothetical protein